MNLKKLTCLILAGIMIIPLFSACSQETVPSSPSQTTDSTSEEDTDFETEEKNPESKEPLPKNKTYSILFIGNSYTNHNNMATELFLPAAKSAGYTVQVTTILNGGHTLEAFANPNDTFGAKVAAELDAANIGKYDFVVLQEQSLRPIKEPGRFYDGVRALAEKINAIGAVPVLYSTWGRKTGSSDLTDLNMTNESMTWTLAANYAAIAREINAQIAHVGLSFFDVYTNATDIELYAADFYHPSYEGSYLAAITLFAEIFGVDPTTLDFRANVSEANANILRNAAKTAVFQTPEIPSEYRTSSEGIVGVKVDTSMMRNLTQLPSANLISVLRGGSYANGKNFSGILGTKGKIASTEYSGTALTDAQKADIADIGYGVSVIGVDHMDSSSKGYTTAIENLVNGHWGTSMMSSLIFDNHMYDVNGNVAADGKYRALITLNFGKMCRFTAAGFASGNMNGFPAAADIYVSSDGVNWILVPSACWNKIDGASIAACSNSNTLADPWNGNTTNTICLFDMAEVEGMYVRIGVITGRNDKESYYNTINTREVLVYGTYLQ